ncbi:hypothetical protein AM493_07790 [Flavobacterium akiainvivens]|uniref:Uncharacterized protein n=1 Tax=Flavobacterium akiainvivens TaxID=1202724 RepID=A0A0M8MHY1_9FLAO|nr:hypothetical protein [Flavobacterium akiainvivens]KOS05948.1 hypothetical protein AM493_07790 [Flavobacterium akiainvivens]SFQ53540.1 hypothetical protein SAMN05444144_10738 [Flavobacterium akiainvivens]
METKIKYTDWQMNEIPVSEINAIKQYQKRYFVDGKEIKSELFINQEYDSTYYYINGREDVQQILRDNPNAHFSFSYENSGYEISETLHYENAILIDKMVYVDETEPDGASICWAKVKFKDDAEKVVEVEKYYNVNGERKYLFYYDSDGNCEKIYGEDDVTEDVWPSQIGIRPDVTFTWEGFEYYRHALPLIPEK